MIETQKMASAASVQVFDTFDAYIDHMGHAWHAQHVFMLPRWMQTWRQAFTPDDELYLSVIKMDGKTIGVAPLSINGATASFVGSADVCDYMDFSVTPGYEGEFYNQLLDALLERHVTELDLGGLRPESTVFPHLAEAVQERDGTCSFEPDGVSLEMDLPRDWDEYLEKLDGKQRHEIRRKLRRLSQEGETGLIVLQDPEEIAGQFDIFLKMFRDSRSDKAGFMDARMESFFRSMTRAMSEEGVLRLFMLTLNGAPAAAALCFDYRDTVYLYNSGYAPRYSSLSVGLLCKILSIRHSIEIGRKKYDFLKGAEPYKYQLGGKEVHLRRCRIRFG
jgi:CelD/BcsL family acetyltransferase involved in cellulose biosynthesis